MAFHRSFRTRVAERARRTISAAIIGVAASASTLSAQTRAAASSDAPTGRTQTADQQVHHVLNRLAFGARPGDVARVRAMGVDAWIAQQLHPADIPDPITDTWLTQFPALEMSGAEFTVAYPSAAQLQRAMDAPDSATVRDAVRALARASNEVAIARIGRAVSSERQLQEVMVDFWANHFNVFIGKPQTRAYVAEYEREAIRPHVLGSFRDLLGAVAKSPAMLTYLDQAQSVADSGQPTAVRPNTMRPNSARPNANRNDARRPNAGEPTPSVMARARGINENYARELMELHTLGVDGGFTQQDVTEVARALTGWTLDRAIAQGGSFVFQRRGHDAGAKTILGQTFPDTHRMKASACSTSSPSMQARRGFWPPSWCGIS